MKVIEYAGNTVYVFGALVVVDRGHTLTLFVHGHDGRSASHWSRAA